MGVDQISRPDWRTCVRRVGIVVAMQAEARCITSHCLPFDQTITVHKYWAVRVCGIGSEAAHRAAADLYDRENVSALISFGVAGALDDRLRPGDLVMPESVLMDRNYPTDQAWRTRIERLLPDHINIIHGILVSSQQVLTTATEKRALAAQTGACAVDMESGAVAAVAAEKGIPFIAVRAITDPVQYSPPVALMSALRPDGSVKLIQLLTLLLKRSINLHELLRLARSMQAACATLKSVVRYAENELSSNLQQ